MQRRILVKFKKSLFAIIACSLFLGTSIASQNFNKPNHYESRVFNAQEVLENEEASFDIDLEVSTIAYTDTSASLAVTASLKNGSQNSYYLGYGESEEDEKPATLVYTVKSGRKSETREAKIIRINKNAFYDGLGNSLGSTSVSTYVDVTLYPKEEIDYEKGFELKNVVEAIQNESTGLFEPKKVDGKIDFKTIKGTSAASIKVLNFNDLIKIDYVGSSSFGSYSDFKFKGEGFGKDKYSTLGSNYRRLLKTHEKDIESGVSWIRTKFNFSNDSIFEFYMSDGNVIKKPALSQKIDFTFANSKMGVLYKDIDASEVKNIKFYNFYIDIDIFASATDKAVPRSNFSLRISSYDSGIDDIKDANGNIYKEKAKDTYFVNSTLLVSLSVAISLLVYVGVSLFFFFYLSKKNKDDEFKRIRPKQYFKTNIMGLLTVEFLIIAIESIALRASVLYTSFRVYNEIDVYIIVFSIASIIFVGYFIKYFINQIKNNIDKKKMDMLNKNKYSDDGTLTINK